MRRRNTHVTQAVKNRTAYRERVMGWRAAMQAGLYGPGGFFVRGAEGPAGHFRTSVHAGPVFAGAVARLVELLDAALGRPEVLDVVDVGAGRGELLSALVTLLPAEVAARARLVAVELAPRPPDLAGRIGWRADIPDRIEGILLATEWLDNIPLDVADVDDHGRARKVVVDPATGAESLGGPLDAADRFWISRWWPPARTVRPRISEISEMRKDTSGGESGSAGSGSAGSGSAGASGRVEIGWPRDAAWAGAVERVRRGVALAVDYGHVRAERPKFGTLAGFRGGRQVAPVPDGSGDMTAHVAIDAVAGAAGVPYRMLRQREALQALGIDGARPPIELARTDPAGYLRALSAAGAAAELTARDGLGDHWWLLHTIGLGDEIILL